jgi:hypothetical protein
LRNGASQVDPSKLNVLAAWKHNYTLETVLVELRRYVGLGSTRKPLQAGDADGAGLTADLQGDGHAQQPQAAPACRGNQLLSGWRAGREAAERVYLG